MNILIGLLVGLFYFGIGFNLLVTMRHTSYGMEGVKNVVGFLTCWPFIMFVGLIAILCGELDE